MLQNINSADYQMKDDPHSCDCNLFNKCVKKPEIVFRLPYAIA